ncbi:hypothetical protein NHX12_012043 [Muraenolepis orangiensis]|uniref:Uncharacterized protein n=1 Tax=Muraenolepis orangiensis TaxID=630683 RepID=A0A9Q0DGZ7_9TELE|nr:hypothetical protein NHX12_012043 [Muraenolepis orangiensis]
MADGAVEINTAEEDGGAKHTEHEVGEVSAGQKDHGDERVHQDEPGVENTWTTPIWSLARKATETMSSGVIWQVISVT